MKNSSTTVTDPVNIANEFNKYFVQTGPQLAKKIPNDNGISYRNYLKGNYAESIFIEPIEIVEPLTYIYNLSFSTGIIPNFLKIFLDILQFLKETKLIFLKTTDQYRF